MTTISPELAHLLRTIDFPAHASDLVREAIRERVPQAEVRRLEQMTPRSYTGRFDVLRELRWNHAVAHTGHRQPVLA